MLHEDFTTRMVGKHVAAGTRCVPVAALWAVLTRLSEDPKNTRCR